MAVNDWTEEIFSEKCQGICKIHVIPNSHGKQQFIFFEFVTVIRIDRWIFENPSPSLQDIMESIEGGSVDKILGEKMWMFGCPNNMGMGTCCLFSLGLCVMSVKTVKILESKVYGAVFVGCLSEKLF